MDDVQLKFACDKELLTVLDYDRELSMVPNQPPL